MIKDKDIICISTSDWETPYGSRQQIMSILAKNNRILYVEPQLSVLHILKNPIRGLKRIIRWLRGISKKEGFLYIYTPMPVLPFTNYSILINRINQKILAISLRRITKRVGFPHPILWIYTVNSILLLGQMNESLSIYYCIDDFRSEIAIEKRRAVLSFLEDNLLKKADIIFTCAKLIAQKMRDWRADIHFIRNGVDFDSFSREFPLSMLPPEMRNIPSPRIGFVGTLDARINIGLLSYLASHKPNWQIILIGYNLMSSDNRTILKKFPNIHYLGFKKHNLLPGYIYMMDVCIIPYYTEGFNRSVFPLKILEYFAVGKPVVSTNLSELAEFQEVVKLSQGHKDFMDNIDSYLKDNGNLLKRREIAAGLSWVSRVEIISKIISEKL